MNIEEFLINLGSNMTNNDREQLQDIISRIDGVISTHFSDEQKCELVVTYNIEKTNPKVISETVGTWNINTL